MDGNVSKIILVSYHFCPTAHSEGLHCSNFVESSAWIEETIRELCALCTEFSRRKAGYVLQGERVKILVILAGENQFPFMCLYFKVIFKGFIVPEM